MGQKVHPIGIRRNIPSTLEDRSGGSTLRTFFQRKDSHRLPANAQGGAYAHRSHFFYAAEDLVREVFEKSGYFLNRCSLREAPNGLRLHLEVFHRSRTSEGALFQTSSAGGSRGRTKAPLRGRGSLRKTSWTGRRKIPWRNLRRADLALYGKFLRHYLLGGAPLQFNIKLLQSPWTPTEKRGLEGKLAPFRRLPSFEDAIALGGILQREAIAPLLADFIASELQEAPRHGSFLNFFFQLLDETLGKRKGPLGGCLIQVKGRLDGASRSRIMNFRWGSVPLHTLDAPIDYAHRKVNTKYGVCGLKVWLNYK